MAARTYMIEYRERKGLSLKEMAKKCEISTYLLEMLENSEQDVTHPKIAERIGKVYKLKPEQVEGLMPEHYRKSSPNYNPDLYKIPDTESVKISARGGKA